MVKVAGTLALILTVISCTSSLNNAMREASASPVPDVEGLMQWLGDESQFFIQMADTQLGMYSYSLPMLLLRATYKDDQFEKDALLFESAIRHANNLRPAFVIVCGDLVNRVGHAGQIAEWNRIASLLDPSIPLHAVAGNHDVGNEPTAETLLAYRNVFGPDRYSFQEGGIHAIVLNSQLIDAPESVPEEAKKQLSWVRGELDRARAAGAEHIVVFQHQPLFLESPDEDDEYFNIERSARTTYLELFKEAGVEAVFAGHLHKNALGRNGEMQMVTTGPVGRPLGDDPSGFRIIAVSEGSLRHEYFSLENR